MLGCRANISCLPLRASVRLFNYPTMTSWHITYEIWASHEVPEVSIMTYKTDLHRFASPWWSVKHNEQPRYSESPCNDRLPSFMDPDCDEKLEYEKLTHKMHEQHERNEFLRLKKKFGDSL